MHSWSFVPENENIQKPVHNIQSNSVIAKSYPPEKLWYHRILFSNKKELLIYATWMNFTGPMSEKKSISKGHILCDPTHRTPLNWQNCRNGDHNSGCWGRYGGWGVNVAIERCLWLRNYSLLWPPGDTMTQSCTHVLDKCQMSGFDVALCHVRCSHGGNESGHREPRCTIFETPCNL